MTQPTPLHDIINRLKSMKTRLQQNYFVDTLKKLCDIRNRLMPTKPTEKPMKQPITFRQEAKEFVQSMFSAMFLALVLRTFLLQPFNIPSESMLPNLLVGDYLFVNKFAYGYSKYSFPFAPNVFDGRIFGSDPVRGDVVVFRVVDDGDKDYIKRIVGLPGDKIRFENGSIIVNGKPALVGKIGSYGTDTIDPETIGADILTENLNGKKYNIVDVVYDAPYDNTTEYVVPKGHYFFAGDNRDNSQDSRFFHGPVGFVPKDRVIGRAEFIFFSIKNSSALEFWNWFGNIRFDRIFKGIE
jgi:signal peptidase I